MPAIYSLLLARMAHGRGQPDVALMEEPEHAKVEANLVHVLEEEFILGQPAKSLLRRFRVCHFDKLRAPLWVHIPLAPSAGMIPPVVPIDAELDLFLHEQKPRHH